MLSKICKLGIVLTSVLAVLAPAEIAVGNDKPALKTATVSAAPAWKSLPSGYDKGSEVEYDMADWDLILEKSVVYTGRSDRRRAKRPAYRTTGTNLQHESTSPYRLEGNKVMFHMLNNRHKDFIRETVDRLAKLPAHVPLETLSRDAQLAYWLNLRNAMVLEKIIDVYPVKRLSKYTAPGSSLRTEPVVEVLGLPLSVQDIEKHIINTFKDPLVFYGFYWGSIGSPNIRTGAFKGETIWEDLESNAVDYVNSLRGVQIKGRGTVAKVSSLYGEYPELFDTDSPTFIRHLEKYAEGTLSSQLAIATQADVSIDDWGIGDIVNGTIGTTLSNTTILRGAERRAAFLERGLPPHAKTLMERIRDKNRRRYRDVQATVEIEELSPKERDNINSLLGDDLAEEDDAEDNEDDNDDGGR